MALFFTQGCISGIGLYAPHEPLYLRENQVGIPLATHELSNQLLECQDYDLLMKDMADRQIEFDLDDGVTENYKMFESVVAKVK